jgi:uncharacterized protein YlxW (UPF0749 family)
MAVTTAGPSVATDAVAPEPRPRSASWVVQVTALSLVLGCFLGLALRAQRTIREARLPATRYSTLVPYYEALKDANQNLQQEVRELRQKMANYETRMAAGSNIEETLKKKLHDLEMLSGLVPVEGPGLVITLQDSPKQIPEGMRPEDVPKDAMLIHDKDLALMLNELKAAGAEALAISGADRSRPQRVILNSAPRCSGAPVRVNDALFSGPFTIWAIGNPVELENALRMPGGLIDNLQLEVLDMIKIQQRSLIKIPAYSSSIKYEYARPVAAPKPIVRS